MKKYVLTGGPGIGKTTLIEILASRGYTIVPESARMVIEEEKLKESDILPQKNIKEFQTYVAKRQLRLEEAAEKTNAKDSILFLDRGIIDGYAYCKNASISPPKIILEEGRNRYSKVFLLEPVSYKNDGIRFEDEGVARKIQETISLVYKELGYELISVPKLPPEERTDFILNHTH